MIGPEDKAHGINEECYWHVYCLRVRLSERTQEKNHNIRMQITKSRIVVA